MGIVNIYFKEFLGRGNEFIMFVDIWCLIIVCFICGFGSGIKILLGWSIGGIFVYNFEDY